MTDEANHSGIQRAASGEALQPTPQARVGCLQDPRWKALYEGSKIKGLSGTGSGMQLPSLPAKSSNRFGRMKTPPTRPGLNNASLTWDSGQAEVGERKGARLRDLERLCKASRLRGDPTGDLIPALGAKCPARCAPLPKGPHGSATDPVFPLPCLSFQNSLREFRALHSSFRHLFRFP